MPATASLVSLSNELNGLIEFFEKLFSLGEKGATRFRRYKAGKAADTLHNLHFPPGGFRSPLENIAAGKSTAADFEALASFGGQTAARVAQGVHSLNAYLDVVRKQCGGAASAKLEELLHGPDGKFVIRYEIEGLVQMVEGGHSTSSDRSAQAQKILRMISEFNAKLVDIHDTIFPPKGAPK